MNDSMTSVPDPAGDMGDELSGISPELVLVDPELARRLREREPAAQPVLWLVPPAAAPAAPDTGVDLDREDGAAEVDVPIAEPATPDTHVDVADTAPAGTAPPDTGHLGADDRTDDGEPAANVASAVALPLEPPESHELVVPMHVDESPATTLDLPPAVPTTDRDAPPDVEPSDRAAALSGPALPTERTVDERLEPTVVEEAPPSPEPIARAATHHAAPPRPVSLAPPSRRRRRGRRVLVFLLGVAAATAGVLVATFVMEDTSTPEPTVSSTPGAGTSSPPTDNAAGQAGARTGTGARVVTKPPAARKSKPGSSTATKSKPKPKPKPRKSKQT
jgi:hypothetical protein